MLAYLCELDNGCHVNIGALNHLVRTIVTVIIILVDSTHLQGQSRAANRRTRAQTKASGEGKNGTNGKEHHHLVRSTWFIYSPLPGLLQDTAHTSLSQKLSLLSSGAESLVLANLIGWMFFRSSSYCCSVMASSGICGYDPNSSRGNKLTPALSMVVGVMVLPTHL